MKNRNQRAGDDVPGPDSMNFSRLFPLRLFAVSSILAMFVFLGTACRRQELPEGMPPLVPVTLTFTQENKPLAEANVSLMPEDTQSRWSAGGATNAVGAILPMTLGQYAGIVPGKYRVTVTKSEEDAFHLVDPVYSTVESTPLILDVTPEQKTASFDLGAPVRLKIVPSFP